MEDLIISGLETTQRMHASTVARDKVSEDALPEELQTLEKQVIKFFERKNMNSESNNGVALPRKNGRTRPAIIVRFVNRRHKTELPRQEKKLKGSKVYLNEHLTKENANVSRHACILRKQNKIQATWTRTCK